FLPGENDGPNPFPSILGGNCFWGKIPIDLLCSSLDKCVNWIMGRKVEMVSATDMHPTILKPSLLDKDSYLTFETHDADAR
ncbi:hypothetical protein, partial [Mycobacterium tuberculosis]|uniref:hypothetical protein n=1 Tax=Mycobacterium tuberculosis TaxID=1773 RepID=UPI00254FD6FF